MASESVIYSNRHAWFTYYILFNELLYQECQKITDGTHITVEIEKFLELKEKAWMYDDLTK